MAQFSRREIAAGALAAFTFGPGALAQRSAAETAFSPQTVLEEARALAGRSYTAPAPLPPALARLDYDAYRAIRYRPEAAIWARSRTRFSIQMFAPGSIYTHGVDVMVVENGRAQPAPVAPDAFETPTPEIGRVLSQIGKLAGFRLHYPINRPDVDDEFLVFQGASYLRAVSQGQLYGLSARGLALGVGSPQGEEFPAFRRFWIERPAAGAASIVVHALLDSPSVTGAYRFGVYPGAPTALDVSATLFPRVALTQVGLGCLTSMFLYGPMDPGDQLDYRPSVHDSQGLAMHTGAGERLWRPLTNPRALQISAFLDSDPRGFGLVQRARDFATYEDLEARYEKRPSAWVQPSGSWGSGHVQLVEIPSDSEGNDNIVASWRPADPLPAGRAFEFGYRLTWPDSVDPGAGLAQVRRSALGRRLDTRQPQFVIDYSNPARLAAEAVSVELTAPDTLAASAHLAAHPVTGGLRVYVDLAPRDSAGAEIALRLLARGAPAGETWLYRWSPRG